MDEMVIAINWFYNLLKNDSLIASLCEGRIYEFFIPAEVDVLPVQLTSPAIVFHYIPKEFILYSIGGFLVWVPMSWRFTVWDCQSPNRLARVKRRIFELLHGFRGPVDGGVIRCHLARHVTVPLTIEERARGLMRGDDVYLIRASRV